MCDPYLRSSVTPTKILNGLGTNAVPVHGGFYGRAVTTGSLAAGNLVLYTFDNTMPSVATNSTGGKAGAIGVGSSYFNSTLQLYGQSAATGPNNQIGITAIASTNCLYRYTIGGTANVPWNHAPELAIALGLNILGLDGSIILRQMASSLSSRVVRVRATRHC